MKFLKNLVGKWDAILKRYVFAESETFTYSGMPIHAFGSGGGGGTETVPTGPWAPQIPYINGLMQQAAQLYNQGAPQYPDFSTVAGQNPMLAQSQQNINNYVNQQQGMNTQMQQSLWGAANQAGNNAMSQVANPLSGQLSGGLQQLLQSGNNPLTQYGMGTQGGAMNAINAATSAAGRPVGQMQLSGAPNLQYSSPDLNFNPAGLQQVSGAGVNANPAIQANLGGSGLNPFIDQTINAATRSLTNNFQRNVLPGIGDDASGAGQFGGTRQGVAQGIAAGDYMNTVGDVTNQLYGRGFDANVAAQQQAINQAQQGQLGQGQLQGQAAGLGLQGLLGQGNIALGAAQAGNQRAGVEVQAGNLQEMIRNNMMQSGLQGAQLSQQGLQGGLNYGLQGLSTGTSQIGNLLQSGNQAAMNQYFQAMGMIPGVQSNQLAQYGAQNQAGQQIQGQNQAQLTDDVNRYFYNMYSPYNALSQYQNFVGGSFGSSVGDPNGSQLYNPIGSPGQQQPPNTGTPGGPNRDPRRDMYGGSTVAPSATYGSNYQPLNPQAPMGAAAQTTPPPAPTGLGPLQQQMMGTATAPPPGPAPTQAPGYGIQYAPGAYQGTGSTQAPAPTTSPMMQAFTSGMAGSGLSAANAQFQSQQTPEQLARQQQWWASPMGQQYSQMMQNPFMQQYA